MLLIVANPYYVLQNAVAHMIQAKRGMGGSARVTREHTNATVLYVMCAGRETTCELNTLDRDISLGLSRNPDLGYTGGTGILSRYFSFGLSRNPDLR